MSVAVAVSASPSAAVPKLDGQVPETTNFVSACSDSPGASTVTPALRVEGGGVAPLTSTLEIAWRLFTAPVPALKPRYALAGSVSAWLSTCVPST